MTSILKFPGTSQVSPSVEPSEKSSYDGLDFLVFDVERTTFFQSEKAKDCDASHINECGDLDWTNQELANIYRVKHLLDAAEVPTILDRGVSDEGEPWCVFCTIDGDVFIHLSRIDGLYWLDSPKLKSPLNGLSFEELIQGFTDLSDVGASAGSGGVVVSNVVRLKKNNAVFLHPSVMLAALVWSLYFGSDEILVPVLENEKGSSDQETPLSPQQLSHNDLMDGLRLDDFSLDFGKTASDSDGFKSNEQKIFNVATTGFSLSVTLGLGSIAVACSLVSDNQWDEITDLLFGKDSIDNAMRLSINDETMLSAMISQSFELIAVLVAQSEERDALDVREANLSEGEMGQEIEFEPIILKAEDVIREDAQLPNDSNLYAELKKNPTILGETPLEYANSEMANVLQEANPAEEQADAEWQSSIVHQFLDYFSGKHSLHAVKMNEATFFIEAGFDGGFFDSIEIVDEIVSGVDVKTSSVLASHDVSTGEAAWDAERDLPLFDDRAQKFVFGLFEETKSMQFVLVENDLVFFDLEVYQNGEDRIQMSWDTGDGGTISLLAAQSDFIEYGIV